jgi:hypothetical protein
LLKKIFLHKLDFFILSRSLPGARALMPLLFATHSSFPLVVSRPILSAIVVRCCHCLPSPLSLSVVTLVVACHCHCHCLPSPLLSSTAIVVLRHHLPPPQVSSPLRVSVIICHCHLLPLPLSSSAIAIVVFCLHRCCCLPPLSSTATIFRLPSHHPHSVSPLSLTARSRPSPSQSATQSCMSLSSAVAVPPLIHVDCWIVSHAGLPQQVICDGINSLTPIRVPAGTKNCWKKRYQPAPPLGAVP